MVLSGVVNDISFEVAQGDDKHRWKIVKKVGFGFYFYILLWRDSICIRVLKPRNHLLYHEYSDFPKGKVCYIRCIIGENNDDNDSEEYWIQTNFVISDPLH